MFSSRLPLPLPVAGRPSHTGCDAMTIAQASETVDLPQLASRPPPTCAAERCSMLPAPQPAS